MRIKMENTNNAASFNKHVEQDRIYYFLAGINHDFDQVRVQVLGKEKLLA